MNKAETELDGLKVIVFNLHMNQRLDAIEYSTIVRKLIDLECEVKNLNMHIVMPPLVGFKERRLKLRLSMQRVTNNTGVSKATISRIERGHKADYENVMKLNNFYAKNGA